MSQEPALLLWGKAHPPAGDGPSQHPLVCHMLDVMHVGDLLWQRLPETSRGVMSRPFGSGENARRWLRLLVALHDAGKATPEFQDKSDFGKAERILAGLTAVNSEGAHHGISGVPILTSWLTDRKHINRPLPRTVAASLARSVAAHHGSFSDKDAAPKYVRQYLSRWIDSGSWRSAHETLFRLILDAATEGSQLTPWQETPKYPHAEYTAILAGLTAVADWIGSNTDYFPYSEVQTLQDVVEYREVSHSRAEFALRQIGWDSRAQREPREFEQLFEFPPRELQVATRTAISRMRGPSLVIIESAMGDGKTEAALLVAEHASTLLGQRGIFLGLPTQATSNQLFQRLEKFLKRTAFESTNLHLAHGDSALSQDYMRLRGINDETTITPYGSSVRAEEWFVQKKRTLLADYAVGTIDQALLGVLWTKHHFVRLFGLAGKVIIVDEVHAYDTYTSRILDRLLAWLGALGSTVILLSATLPRRRRLELFQAFGSTAPLSEASYPRISMVSREEAPISIGTRASRPSHRIALRRFPDAFEELARELVSSITNGGCAAWICNSVSRAQQAFAAVRSTLNAQGLDDTPCILLHSRFLRKDRADREKTALSMFGPPHSEENARPRRAILIGTQVVEQSLDLDFDVMVSDFAPIDLLWQRVGRLHRHKRDRPPEHQAPTLWLVVPPLDQHGIPKFDQIARVYDEDIMVRSFAVLSEIEAVTIPDELENSIEKVYGGHPVQWSSDALRARYEQVHATLAERRRSHLAQADASILPIPPAVPQNDPLSLAAPMLDDDESSEAHRTLVAHTRLGQPTVEVICLWRTSSGPSFTPDGIHSVPDLDTPDGRLQRELLAHSVKLDEWRAKSFGSMIERPVSWERIPNLRNRSILWLSSEAAEAGIALHPELGVTFSRPSD